MWFPRQGKPWLLCLGAMFLLLSAAAAAPAGTGPQRPGREHLVYFANTPDELSVYRVYGARDGKTLMIVGGIQGDEPGGFLSADLYADLSLVRGNLIVVPRANFYSIILNQRGPDGDMNRQFGDPVTALRQKKIVDVIKQLIAESDLLLNLHDGSGFFRTRYESPLANPQRYGQSLIADTDVYRRPDGGVIDLKVLAEKVLARVNPQIPSPAHHLLFNNHRTSAKDSPNKEQRLSATYYALTRCQIPAFGVETSKSLPTVEMKIRHHALVVNAFMEELGVVPEHPGCDLEQPQLKYLVVTINDDLPVVVRQDAVLQVAAGDRINVQHIEANYDRGLTCDLEGVGSVNDTRQSFVIQRPTQIVVRKDSQTIGRVRVEPGPAGVHRGPVKSHILYLVVEVAGQRRVVADGESLNLVKGDTLTVVDVLSNLPDQSNLRVNFKGFVPHGGGNTGEDRGFPINTASDLLPRYSHCPGGGEPSLECYQVVVKQGERPLGGIDVKLVPAKLDYVVIRREGGYKMVYQNGETIRTRPGERLEVMDLKTNVKVADELALELWGKAAHLKLQGGAIPTDDHSLRRLTTRGKGDLKLMVMRQAQTMGHVRLEIGGR
ncbi:MAG: hypothetical protein KQJ78_02005 [Deltaproteobacteria bacterium]|nr:hypothetical protein [Deltaproteobacteria bacterium]